MRDPKRIDVVLKEIGEVWKQVPDQRLGQLLTNFVGESINFDKFDSTTQLNEIRHLRTYYIEEDELLENIKKFKKKELKKKEMVIKK